MKRTLVYGAATAMVALTLGTGTGLLSSCTREGAVVTLYGVPVVDPSPTKPGDNPIVDLYGTPVFFSDDNDQGDDTSGTGTTSGDNNPAVQPEPMLPSLYGPPTATK